MKLERVHASAWVLLAALCLCSRFATHAATVTLQPAQSGGTGHDLVVPGVVDPADGVAGTDFVFTCDTLVRQATGVYLTAYTDAFALSSDLATPGQVSAPRSFGGPLAGTNDWKVVLGLGDPDGILGLDLALRSGGLVTLRSVQAVGIAQGSAARGNEQAGKVAPSAASSILGTGAFLELVVSGSPGAVDPIGAALTAPANEGATPGRWATERRRQPNKVAPRAEERP